MDNELENPLKLDKEDLFDGRAADAPIKSSQPQEEAFQEEEYADRADFVKNHSLFKSWHPKFKKLLEMSLIKEVHGYDSTVVKQGDEWKGIYFLRSGKADIMVEPGKHNTQYPDMSPFRNTNDVFEVELGIPNKRLSPIKKLNEFDRNRTKAVERIYIRRHDGYAAAEKRVSSRNLELCSLGPGEMFGDIELVMNLPTYFHSVVSKSQTEFYVLTAKNYERLVTKKYPNTIDTLKLFVEIKLKNRSSSNKGQNVPLLKHLLFRISGNMKSLALPKSPLSMKMSKDLPEKEVLFQHLVNSFKENKAELCQPLIPGSIYLREIMRHKARARHVEKSRKVNEIKENRRRVKKPPSLKPRTMKEIKAALERQRMEEEEVEKKILLEEIRAREADEFRKMELNTVNLKNFIVQFQDPILLGHDGFNNNNSNSKPDEEQLNLNKDQQPPDNEMTREKTFITEVDLETNIKEKEYAKPTETKSNPEKKKHKKEEQPLRPASADVENGLNIDQSNAEEENDLVLDLDGDPVSISRQGFISNAQKQEDLSRAESKMKFVTALMRKGVEVPENPTYRDWETSDKSIAYLEERIKRFAKKHGESDHVIKILPKLRRFEENDESSHHPMPGGKVIVRPRACIQKTSTKAITDHSHTSYTIVPKIPDYEKLRRSKMVFQKDLENKRENWMLNTNDVT